MSPRLKTTDASGHHLAAPNRGSSDPLLGNARWHSVQTFRGAASSPVESGKESASRAAADWQMIRRMMQGVLGDDTWPKGRTSDGKALFDRAQNGEPVWRVGHQSYRVLRHEPHGAEELIEAGPSKIRRIGWGVIHEEQGILNQRAQQEASPSQPTERNARDHIRRRRKRR
jgi:hypothetical protein